MQSQRLELKYRISESTAIKAREFIRCYMKMDDNCRGGKAYANHSVYLDSPGLDLYWDVMNGTKNRYKLRLRYYDMNPESPVSFEIKRRENNAILKERAWVKRSCVLSTLSGIFPRSTDFIDGGTERSTKSMTNFFSLMLSLDAIPKTRVSYMREAWVDGSEHVRITFDRNIKVMKCIPENIMGEMVDGMYFTPFEPEVIFEIKFTDTYPRWVREMVQNLGITQMGCAKYADGVAFLKDRHN